MLYAVSYGAAFSAIRPEVYALSTLLLLATLLFLVDGLRSKDERALRRAALVGGLGLVNHHLLMVAAVLPAFLILIRPPRRAALAALAVLLAVSLYVYLPARASQHPTIDWGAPTTIERFVWTVSARAFQKSVARSSTSDPELLLGAVAAESGLVGLLAGSVGLYLLVRRKQARLSALLGSSILLTIAAPALVGFDEANPDAYGYLSGAIAVLAALAAVPLGVLAQPRRAAAVAATLALAALVLLALNRPRYDLAGHHTTDEVARYLEAVPPRQILVTSYFQTAFLVLYAQSVEGRRPDVRQIDRHFLTYPGYRDELLARWPDVAPLLGRRDVAAIPSGAVVEYAQDLPAAFVPTSTLPEVTLSDEPQARRFVAWMRLLAVHRACRLHDRASLDDATARAEPLLGRDPDYRQLLQRCSNLDTVEAP